MTAQRPRTGIGRAIAAFTLGASAGSILALLFAPASGKVTRTRVAQKFRQLQRTAGGKLGKGIVQARSWVMDHMPNGHVTRRPLHAHHN